jgi:hypothetical protein
VYATLADHAAFVLLAATRLFLATFAAAHCFNRGKGTPTQNTSRSGIARVDGNAARVAGASTGSASDQGKAATGSGERVGTRTSFKRISEIEGKAASVAASERSRGDASDVDGQNREVEWSFGKSDPAAAGPRWVVASELGSERVSDGREHMSQCGRRASFNGANGMSDPAAAGLRGKQRVSVGNERVSNGAIRPNEN